MGQANALRLCYVRPNRQVGRLPAIRVELVDQLPDLLARGLQNVSSIIQPDFNRNAIFQKSARLSTYSGWESGIKSLILLVARPEGFANPNPAAS